LLIKANTYAEVYAAHQWRVPERFNMGVDVCDKHAVATPDKTALIVATPDGDATHYSFAAMQLLSNKLANLLRAKASNAAIASASCCRSRSRRR